MSTPTEELTRVDTVEARDSHGELPSNAAQIGNEGVAGGGGSQEHTTRRRAETGSHFIDVLAAGPWQDGSSDAAGRSGGAHGSCLRIKLLTNSVPEACIPSTTHIRSFSRIMA